MPFAISSPPSALTPLFNLSSPLNPADHPDLLPAFKDPANQPFLEAHQHLRAYRINLALDQALLDSIQTLTDVQKTATSDADRRRAATVIVHLFKSNSRTQRTQAAAGASPSPTSSPAPSTPRHLGTSTPPSPIPHDSYTPKPYKLKSGIVSQPCDVEPLPEHDLQRIVGGPPHPYNLTSPAPDKLPPPPPEATPRDVVRTALRTVRQSSKLYPTDQQMIAAIFESLAPSLQARGLDQLPSVLSIRSPGFFCSGVRTTIEQPVYRPVSDRKDQPPSHSGPDKPLQSATVLVTRHRPHCNSSCTFHLIHHDPTTDPGHPLPPIWLTSHIEPTEPNTS